MNESNPCPSWCEQWPPPDHRHATDPMDREHWSQAEQLDMAQHGAMLMVSLRQQLSAAAPSVVISVDDNTDIGASTVRAAEYRLTVAEADRLATLLQHHVTLARGTAG